MAYSGSASGIAGVSGVWVGRGLGSGPKISSWSRIVEDFLTQLKAYGICPIAVVP